MEVTSAKYIEDYKVEVTFSTGRTKLIDFKNRFKKYAPRRWMDINKFTSFKIEEGNIVWGKNWDVIFSIGNLARGRY